MAVGTVAVATVLAAVVVKVEALEEPGAEEAAELAING